MGKKDLWQLREARRMRMVKRYIYQSKMKANEQFGRKVTQDLKRNRKFFLEGSG